MFLKFIFIFLSQTLFQSEAREKSYFNMVLTFFCSNFTVKNTEQKSAHFWQFRPSNLKILFISKNKDDIQKKEEISLSHFPRGFLFAPAESLQILKQKKV
jgi:hypothetical protein